MEAISVPDVSEQASSHGGKTKTPTKLVALLAAKKILEKEIEQFESPPVGVHQIKATQVIVRISAAEVQKAEAAQAPDFATFPMDLAASFFLRRLPTADRTQARADLFSLFERLCAGDTGALTEKEELDVTIEAFKKYKRQCGMKTVKGSVRVHAVKDQITVAKI
jgi:hypothetical protein